jgi:hypothetical protein
VITEVIVSANKKYKDSVFSSLFGNPDVLRELYSAIEGVSLSPDTCIDINTLSDVLFMEQINDISFTVDNRLVVLIEHQSTINENMPLRLLLYIARVYEKINDRKKLYKAKLIKIPAPEFIVLYNGKDPYPDRKTLKLSDAFEDIKGFKGTGKDTVSLELVVQVYNINKGHNPELFKRSKTLDGYSFFVDKVREYEKEFPLEEAVKEAIKYCIEENKIRNFLEEHGTEVINMLLTEWNTEEAKEVWLEEGREERNIEIARNALAKGYPPDLIHDITGLDIDVIENMQ